MLGFHSLSERPISALTPPADPSILASLVNTVTFAQTLDRLVILNPELSNTVSFADTIQRNLDLILANLITFSNDAESQYRVLSIVNTIALSHSISRQLIASRLIEEVIRFEQRIGPTQEGDLTNVIAFLNDIARGENPDNTVGFTDTIEATTSKGLENTPVFENTIEANIEVTRELDDEVEFDNSIIATIERACELHEYSPNGGGLDPEPALSVASGISFVYGMAILDLRNPEFGDETTVNPTVVLHRSRAGTVRPYRSAMWSKRREFTITVRAMDETKKDEVLAFLDLSLGQLVTYTDPESREWEGVLVEPQAPVANNRDCDYVATFRFRGVPA